MANYTVISDISNELVKWLQNSLSSIITNKDEIGVGANVNDPMTHKVGIYLYDIEPMDYLLFGNAIQMAQRAVVKLKYMIVLSGGASAMTALDEHKILGKIIETFTNQNIIYSTELFLSDKDDNISIIMNNISFDDKIKLQTNIKDMIATLFYEAYPVYIDPETKQKKPKRVTQIGGE